MTQPSRKAGRPVRWITQSATALVVLAVVLSLAGGAVPGIAHQVASGNISPNFSPERFLGPPYAGSVSGRWAAEGALFWSVITVAGFIALRSLPPLGAALLAIATLATALINIALPLLWPNTGWSILGVAQTVAVLGALVLVYVARGQGGPRPKAETIREA